MKTDIYLHHGNQVCVIVSSEEGYKFIDNVESFCKTSLELLIESIDGFSGFGFYDQYKNEDILFTDKYMSIMEGDEADYEYLGGVYDGFIDFDFVDLDTLPEYFKLLTQVVRLTDKYNIGSIRDLDYSTEYILLASDSDVLLCTDINIPFEPNAKQKQLRDLLQTKLRKLHPFGDQILYARYGSAIPEYCDVENRLFYNIGSVAFEKCLSKETSVHIERMQSNEVFVEEGVGYKYIYRYEWCPKNNHKYWWEHDKICEWSKIPLENINSSVKPLDYYLAIKNHMNAVEIYKDGSSDAWGLKIKLYLPRKAKIKNVSCIMKAMIDGVICAFHTPDQLDAEEICVRLKIDKKVLLSAEKTCLGERCFVSPYLESVKWNPKDEFLDYVMIEPVIVDDEKIYYSGEIFSLPCYM